VLCVLSTQVCIGQVPWQDALTPAMLGGADARAAAIWIIGQFGQHVPVSAISCNGFEPLTQMQETHCGCCKPVPNESPGT